MKRYRTVKLSTDYNEEDALNFEEDGELIFGDSDVALIESNNTFITKTDFNEDDEESEELIFEDVVEVE